MLLLLCQVEVLVARQYGSDGRIQVDAIVSKPGKGYGKSIGGRPQTLTWEHEDASPKKVFIHVDTISSLCSHQEDSECHVEVTLAHPRSCKIGAYRSVHVSVILRSSQQRPEEATAATAATAVESGPSFVQPISASYAVVEVDGFVDVEVTRTQHTASPPSSIDVAFVASTGSPFIDFHFPENRTLSWTPEGSAVQLFRVFVRPNHNHIPNDTVYITFMNPQGMSVPAQAQVVEVVILNAEDEQSKAERAQRRSSAYRRELMPWVSEITDTFAAQRFLEAWNSFPVRKGEVVVAKGRMPRFLAVVAEGHFEVTGSAFRPDYVRRARRGDIVSFFAPVKRTSSSVEVKAVSDGLMYVLDSHLFHLHNKSGASAASSNAAWCGVVWCGVVWCGVVWCGGKRAVNKTNARPLHLPPPPSFLNCSLLPFPSAHVSSRFACVVPAASVNTQPTRTYSKSSSTNSFARLSWAKGDGFPSSCSPGL